MDIIKSVFDIAEKFMEDPKHVLISKSMLRSLVSIMEEEGPKKFPNELNVEEVNLIDEIKLELLADSINYCYWYGSSNIRPNNTSTVLMYELLNKTYARHQKIDKAMVSDFVALLAENRFPLIEERRNHLFEVYDNLYDFPYKIADETENIEPLFNKLVKSFPGFAADMFLKRASLFFIQLNRKFGWYKDTINELPVPADYQVPKMLEFYGALVYKPDLTARIQDGRLIPKGSLMECEIRAATIIACRLISKTIGWTSQQIDSWLWLRSQKCDRPFHLTITTDY